VNPRKLLKFLKKQEQKNKREEKRLQKLGIEPPKKDINALCSANTVTAGKLCLKHNCNQRNNDSYAKSKIYIKEHNAANGK
jgi:hypothetical protein